jgi:hypothetical protein
MKRHFLLTIPAIIAIIAATGTVSSADTIRLFEGTILVGKIIEENKTAVTFANAYGTFSIKRVRIDDIYKTKSYEEDLAVHRKHNFPINEYKIKKNYVAGENRKEGRNRELIRLKRKEKEREDAREKSAKMAKSREKNKSAALKKKLEADGHWISGRLSFSGAFHYNLGSSGGAMPFGYAGYFALDQGLDFVPGNRHPLIPGLRFEGGYLYFKRSSYSLTGYVFGGGLMWAFPSMKNRWGCFILALIPGASYLEAKAGSPLSGGSGRSRGFNFAAQGIFGYQKSFGVFSMFIQGRYMYIMGKHSYFHSVAGECGFGFNAW